MSMTEQRRNGPNKPASATENLPEDRKKAVEYGLASFQQTATERDQLAKRVSELEHEVAQYKLEHDSMHNLMEALEERLSSQQATSDSRVAEYQVARDEAVAALAKYETVFGSIETLLRTFVPAKPLIRVVSPSTAGDDDNN